MRNWKASFLLSLSAFYVFVSFNEELKGNVSTTTYVPWAQYPLMRNWKITAGIGETTLPVVSFNEELKALCFCATLKS